MNGILCRNSTFLVRPFSSTTNTQSGGCQSWQLAVGQLAVGCQKLIASRNHVIQQTTGEVHKHDMKQANEWQPKCHKQHFIILKESTQDKLRDVEMFSIICSINYNYLCSDTIHINFMWNYENNLRFISLEFQVTLNSYQIHVSEHQMKMNKKWYEIPRVKILFFHRSHPSIHLPFSPSPPLPI